VNMGIQIYLSIVDATGIIMINPLVPCCKGCTNYICQEKSTSYKFVCHNKLIMDYINGDHMNRGMFVEVPMDPNIFENDSLASVSYDYLSGDSEDTPNDGYDGEACITHYYNKCIMDKIKTLGYVMLPRQSEFDLTSTELRVLLKLICDKSNIFTDEQRSTLYMYFYDHMSMPQIASYKGVSWFAIKEHLALALNKFRQVTLDENNNIVTTITKVCPNCGVEFNVPIGSVKKYCSAKCRMSFLRKKSRMNKSKVTPIKCAYKYCDNIIENPKPFQKYCSVLCRKKAQRDRQIKGT